MWDGLYTHLFTVADRLKVFSALQCYFFFSFLSILVSLCIYLV